MSNKIYYGAAPPEGEAITINKKVYQVDGWIENEILRRTLDKKNYYQNRSFLTAYDVIENLFQVRSLSQPIDPFVRAVERLQRAFKGFVAHIAISTNIITLLYRGPVATSALCWNCDICLYETSCADLYNIADHLYSFVSCYATEEQKKQLSPPLPPLVKIKDITLEMSSADIVVQISVLEAELTAPATLIEKYRACIAGIFDLAADIIESLINT